MASNRFTDNPIITFTFNTFKLLSNVNFHHLVLTSDGNHDLIQLEKVNVKSMGDQK